MTRTSLSMMGALVGLATVGLACSGGSSMSGTGGASGTGTGGTTGGGAAAPYKPCADAQKIGAFTLDLKHADTATSNPAYSQVNGGVRDGVRPDSIWVESPVTGAANGCKLMVGPMNACTPACSGTQVCKAGTCQAAPVTKSVGEVTLTGLVVPVKLMAANISGNVVYTGSIPSSTTYPPYTVGDALGLMAAGADYPAFSLAGKGIAPLEPVANQTLSVAKDQPLTIKWMAPPAEGKGRIELIMDIAHHGGVSAEIHCDLEDTGSVTIPAALITALMDKGTFGFPTVSVTRMSADSTTVGPGCLEFNVAAGLELPLSVAGVVSCNDDTGCTAPQHCIIPGYKCGT